MPAHALQGYLVVVPSGSQYATDPVGDLLGALRRGWAWLLAAAVLGALAALGLAWQTTPVYRAQTTLMPIAERGGSGLLSRLPSQVAGFAALAGLGGGGSDLQKEALARLESYDFTAAFVERHGVRAALFPREFAGRAPDDAGLPTLQDAVKKFDEDVRKVHVDEDAGLVHVRVYWHDAKQAADWANALAVELNEQMRTQAVAEAKSSIAFLERELQQTGHAEIRDGLYDLIQTRLQEISLASVRQEYAMRVVDRAVVADPDKYVRPAPVLYTVLGAFGGLVLGAALVLLRVGRSRAGR